MSDATNKALYQYLLILGDNSMILGHRLSELCGHGPSLETDIALTNISLDLFGEVRNLFQYAAKVKGEGSEDDIAFLRLERKFRNSVLVEQANTDFAHVITRQYFYDSYHHFLLTALQESKDETISAIAHKSVKETAYHMRFSSEWMKRLGDGTEESHSKMKTALEHLYPFVHELFQATEVEKELLELGIAADLTIVESNCKAHFKDILSEAKLGFPKNPPRVVDGKNGHHSEQLGYILSEMQYMQRAYPNMEW